MGKKGDICAEIIAMDKRNNTVLLAITSCLLWSTVYSTIKIGLQYDTPLHFAGLRFMLAGLMILPFTIRPKAYLKMVKDNIKLVVTVTLLQSVINYSLFYLGMSAVPGALGAVVVGSQPLFTAVVAAIMDKDDKLTINKLITIIVALSGIVLISVGRQALKIGGLIELVGIGLILLANIATSISNVLVSMKGKNINPFVLSSTSIFSGGVIIYFLSFLFEGTPSTAPKPTEYWAVLVWLGFVSASAFSIWYMVLRRPGVKVSEINLWKFLLPVVGAILSWILVPGEHPEWLTIAGMIIITSSLFLFHRKKKESKA